MEPTRYTARLMPAVRCLLKTERVTCMDDIIKLLGILSWPLTMLIILLLFKRQIIGITELIQRVEGPGGVKIILDRERVETIIKEGSRENLPAEQLAEQIVRSAEVKDTSELRVLRALFDEEEGRLLANYEKYYPTAMKNLLNKGYIEKRDKRYFLTKLGLEATQDYIRNILTRQGAPGTSPNKGVQATAYSRA
jgi:hypothetical protein